MTQVGKADGQVSAQNTQNTQGAKRKPYVPEKVSVWDKTKAFFQGFGEYYADKYEGTQGVGDFFQRTKEIHDEGAEMIDSATFDKVKDPIKNWSQSVADRVDDGDDSHLSLGERMWAATEGVGAIGDKLLSTKGVEVTGLAAGGIALAAGGAVAAAGAIGGEAAATTMGAAIGVTANAAGTVGGTYLAGKGAYDIATADTKDEAKNGGTEFGSGALMLGASAVTAKQTLTAAREAGIQAGNPESMSTVRAMAENVKVAPKAMAQAVGLYKPGAFTTLITATSPELANATKYMSKPNEVKAYRFNPNGSEEEILANNPNVFKTADGKFAIPNKWNPNEPYILDPSKEQMVMMYGGDDFAVCEGSIFKGSYVDTAGFKANGSLNYQDPSKLEYGKIVEVTKQAPGGFVEAPVGTEVKTLEGIRTVGEGDVIAVDHAGNPYVTPKANVLKRNIIEGYGQVESPEMFDAMKVAKENGGRIPKQQMDALRKKYPVQGNYDSATGAKNVWGGSEFNTEEEILTLNGKPFTGVKPYRYFTDNPYAMRDYEIGGKKVYCNGRYIGRLEEYCRPERTY